MVNSMEDNQYVKKLIQDLKEIGFSREDVPANVWSIAVEVLSFCDHDAFAEGVIAMVLNLTSEGLGFE